MNIVGIRSTNRIANKFDDKMVVFYNDDKGERIEKVYKITTDPGYSSLGYVDPKDIYPNKKSHKPKMWTTGCAILKEGQYINRWGIGVHNNSYEALVQKGTVTVHRDNNKDGELNMDTKIETGNFGINIHKPWKECTIEQSEIWNISAGCQVFANPNNFNEFMLMAYQQFQKNNIKKVEARYTYTLMLEEDVRGVK